MGVKVTAITYFQGTEAATLKWAGYEKGRRVIRYTLEATGAGATEIKLVHKYEHYYDTQSYPSPTLCMSLSADGEAYINANGTENGCDAEMEKDTTAKTYTATLRDLKLYPGQTYYLWVYPKTDIYQFAILGDSEDDYTLTSSGSVSVVYIGSGLYLAIIWDGTEWNTYVLILWDGTGWKICSQEE